MRFIVDTQLPPRLVLLLLFGNISNNDLIQYFEEYLDVLTRAFEEGANYVQFGRSGVVVD